MDKDGDNIAGECKTKGIPIVITIVIMQADKNYSSGTSDEKSKDILIMMTLSMIQ